MAAVSQRDVVDVADAEAVDERDSRLDVVDDARALRRQLDDSAVLRQHDPLGRHSPLLREACVRGQHPELAVDRHQRLRPNERDHRP